VFKVPHHCSKNGLNLELVVRVNPSISLISCEAGTASHAFPHQVALEQLREARQAIASSGGIHDDDWKLGIHTTADTLKPNGAPLGTIAIQVPSTSAAPTVWRLGDTPTGAIPTANLRSAHQFK